jgi:hypothetical protein
MANPEHLAILKQGAEAWNRWRKLQFQIAPDLSMEDFRDANLSQMDLSRVNLREASLVQVKLSEANLNMASLSGVDLTRASLTRTSLLRVDLSRAILRGAMLLETVFDMTVLADTDFTGAFVSSAVFANVDLGCAKGLEKTFHRGPSTLGIDTIYRSKGAIPEVFLRLVGVPDVFIAYARSLVGKPFDFYSCFVSHSTKDKIFAERLYADLQNKGVRCWLFPEDAKWGEPLWREIDEGIKIYDKLAVVCSENSLRSPAVLREIERGLQREDREKKNVLFPIRLDDFIFQGWEHERKADVVNKVVGDFLGWKDHDAYQKSLARLVSDLKAEESRR